MPDVSALAESRVRAAAAGLGPDDMVWLDRIEWSDRAVPPIESDIQYQEYRRRERALNAAVSHLSFAERAESAEGRVAAALGARAADWNERDEEGA
jgi:hypothetical protein